MRSNAALKISFNSPVILSYVFACFATLVLNQLTFGRSNSLLFSVYRASLASPFTYIRFVGHVFGHAGWDHFFGNMTILLLMGPLLEEKYGSRQILIVLFSTAFVTGLIHFLFFPGTALLGASGVVFAMILLASFTGFEDGKIPLTFLLVAVIYIGGQIYQGILVRDTISNLTHIIGGIIGAGFGYLLRGKGSH